MLTNGVVYSTEPASQSKQTANNTANDLFHTFISMQYKCWSNTDNIIFFNPLTAMKKIIPTPGVFWSKSNFLKIIYARYKIFLSPCTNIV